MRRPFVVFVVKGRPRTGGIRPKERADRDRDGGEPGSRAYPLTAPRSYRDPNDARFCRYSEYGVLDRQAKFGRNPTVPLNNSRGILDGSSKTILGTVRY